MIRKIAPILGITFIDIVGFSILLPILPYFVIHFGAPKILVGVLFSVFALCQFIGGPIWGNLSDRFGRKIVLIISQIGATIGWVMLAFAPDMTWVFIARIVEGLSGGNISVTQAYVADLVEPEQQTRAYGYIGAAFGAGFVFGPAIGAWTLAHYGYSATFLVAAGLQVLTLLITIVMLPESRSKEDRQERAQLSDIVQSLRDPRVSPLLWQVWMFALSLYAWFAVWALFINAAIGLGASQTGYLFAASGVVNVFVQVFVVGRVSDALGDRTTSNAGLACAVLGFLWVPFVHSIPTLIPIFVLFSLGMALSRASLTALLTKASPINQRGTILGVSSSLDSLSGVLMPTPSTAILEVYGASFSGVLSATFSAIALTLGLLAARRGRAYVSVESDA